MNLYVVTRTDEPDYEEDVSAVIAAESPTLARKIMIGEGKCRDPQVWTQANAVLIGTAKRQTPGVLHVANQGA